MESRDTNTNMDRGGIMRVIKIFYPDGGPFDCWEPIIEAELDRLNLQGMERYKVTVIALPESMRPKGKRQQPIQT
jgi:hypothetical protein